MFKRLLFITCVAVTVSGCFMAPMALIGPVSSGFSTASLIQSGISSSANYMVKKRTGQSIADHAFKVINKDILQQTYSPKKFNSLTVAP